MPTFAALRRIHSPVGGEVTCRQPLLPRLLFVNLRVVPEADLPNRYTKQQIIKAESPRRITRPWRRRSTDCWNNAMLLRPKDPRDSISMGWGEGAGNPRRTRRWSAPRESFVIRPDSSHSRAVFDGMNRDALSDPDDFNSFGPGPWCITMF
jgi:hypothetical protein